MSRLRGDEFMSALLKDWRTRNGFTLEELSDVTGYSVPMLSRLERGERNISALSRIALARRLGVKYETFLRLNEFGTNNWAPTGRRLMDPNQVHVWKTVKQAAGRGQVGPGIIYREVKAGRLRAARIGGRRALRFRDEWIDEWLDASSKPVMSSPPGRAQSPADKGRACPSP